MRKLIKLSIILAVLFLTLFLILFGPNSFNIILLIGLLYLIFLFVLFYKKDKYKTGVTKFLVTVLMVFFNLIFIVFYIILLLNIPKEDSVINRFGKEPYSKYKILNFEERLKTKKIKLEHMEKVNLKHIRTEKVMGIINKNSNYVENILDFIVNEGNNKVKEKNIINNYKLNQIQQMEKICLIELNKINLLIKNYKYSQAKKKYLRMWKSFNILLKQNYSLLELTFFLQIPRHAVHLAEQLYIKNIRSNKIKKEISKFITNVQNSYRQSLIEEYYSWESYKFRNLPEELAKPKAYSKNNFEKIFFSWPFWDRNNFLFLLNYYLHENYKLSSSDFYKVSDKFAALENNRDKQDNFPYFLSNPTGKIFVLYRIPDYVSFSRYVNREISRLKFYSWFISEKFNKKLKDVPIDNLTGEKYNIKRNNNKLIVKSKYKFPGFYNKYELELRVTKD